MLTGALLSNLHIVMLRLYHTSLSSKSTQLVIMIIMMMMTRMINTGWLNLHIVIGHIPHSRASHSLINGSDGRSVMDANDDLEDNANDEGSDVDDPGDGSKF